MEKEGKQVERATVTMFTGVKNPTRIRLIVLVKLDVECSAARQKIFGELIGGDDEITRESDGERVGRTTVNDVAV